MDNNQTIEEFLDESIDNIFKEQTPEQLEFNFEEEGETKDDVTD